MSSQFTYPGDNGSIIWSEQSHDQSSLQYVDANDTIIDDSTINESYVSATDANETQYFSILEHSDDITLEDLQNLTIGNVDGQENIVMTEDLAPAVHDEINQESQGNDEGTEVIVFTVDGSDDLYGIQLAQDEEGNIQKYQFKFRTTEDGQLEAIPETVELLPSDNQTTGAEVTQINTGKVQQQQKYFVVQTQDGRDQQSTEVSQQEVPEENISNEGERQVPLEFAETIDTKHLKKEIAQNHISYPSDEEPLEPMDSVIIKSEIMENIALQNSPINPVNIKQEQFVEEDDDQDEENYNDETLRAPSDHYEESEHPEIIIKQQPQEEMLEAGSDNEQEEIISGQLEQVSGCVSEVSQEEVVVSAANPYNQEQLIEKIMHQNCQIEVEYDNAAEEQERVHQEYNFNEVYSGPENEQLDSAESTDDPNISAHDSDSEQYEIVEGLHVTGEVNDEHQEELVTTDSEPVIHQVVERYQQQNIERTNILKHPVDNTNKNQKSKKPLVSVNYYVVYPEKENVNSLAGNTAVPKVTRPNPRSVLRTSFVKPKEQEKNKKVATDTAPECDLFHKRFAKNKEAMRAKLFHNFLNRTTIPHAPVRHQRQPRKQEIKPVVERSDEEIIVQEVMISSNGFIESLNEGMKNRHQVTAVVELSDSEDERTLRKSHRTQRQTSESELSVIEIHSDDDTDLAKKVCLDTTIKRGKGQSNKSDSGSPNKRRRGRPPKKNKLLVHETSPSSKIPVSKCSYPQSEAIEPDKEESDFIPSGINIDKKEIACPKCPKTFPSQNSLNTHIIHHNLENSLKNKAIMNSKSISASRQSILPKIEYNHKCQSCEETFKNSILLRKHNCTRKQVSLSCSVCLKQFRDLALLNIHRKSHIKSNLVTNTSVAKISPKKRLSRPSSSLVKSPKAKTGVMSKNTFKCKQCMKVCESEDSLATHMKIHKKFLCSSCSAVFSSRLLLDTHVRTNCVKIMSPTNRRLSFKIRKSFVHTPPKRVTICQTNEKSFNTTVLNQTASSLNLECDICNTKFTTYRTWYTHKVQKHGLNTPDKSLLCKAKTRIYKPKAAHGGIPANDRMKKAYAALRQKLAEMQETSNIAQ